MPPLLAVYATSFGNGILLQPEPMFTIAPPPADVHVSRRRLRAQKTALEVRVHDLIPFRFRHVHERCPRLHAGVVDEDVETRPPRRDLDEHPFHVGLHGDIGLDGKGIDAEGADLRDRVFGGLPTRA